MAKQGLIVQKFGGTSVGDAEKMRGVVTIVKNSLSSHRVAVVLSAMSGKTKRDGTTSRLLEAADEVLKGNGARYKSLVAAIKEHHLKSAQDAVTDQILLAATCQDIEAECVRLGSFLEAAEVIGEISVRSMDVIISVGEKLSCRVFTAVLQCSGVDAVFVNLERVIERHFLETQLDHNFYAYLRGRFTEVLGGILNADQVPVITGFFGFVPGGLLNAVGRGYTDFTASLVAAACRADEFQIWKEVDGIFTADPNKVPGARVLSSISPAEAAELTFYGAEVIHPFTMEQAINANIPIRIKNTFNPAGAGTLIRPTDDTSVPSAMRPTAVTVKSNVTLINVASNRKSLAHGFMANIFTIFDRHGVALDLISTSEVNLSMAVSLGEREGKCLPQLLSELQTLGKVSTTGNLAIVSLVGQEMKSVVGLAGKMFTALASANVNIEVISQGASEINISCVIEAACAERAIRSIHDQLILPFL